MFSLITNETCFTIRSDHTRRSIVFIMSITETASLDSFDLSQTEHISANGVFLLNTALPFVPKGLDN